MKLCGLKLSGHTCVACSSAFVKKSLPLIFPGLQSIRSTAGETLSLRPSLSCDHHVPPHQILIHPLRIQTSRQRNGRTGYMQKGIPHSERLSMTEKENRQNRKNKSKLCTVFSARSQEAHAHMVWGGLHSRLSLRALTLFLLKQARRQAAKHFSLQKLFTSLPILREQRLIPTFWHQAHIICTFDTSSSIIKV